MKNYGVKIPITGYRTVYIKADSKEEAINNVLNDGMGVGHSDQEDEIDWDYNNKSDIEIWECDD